MECLRAIVGIRTFFSTLFYATGAGGYKVNQKIDINAPNAPGLTAEITGNSDSLGRVLTITDLSGGQTKFGLLPTGTANQYQLVFASDEYNNPVTTDQFASLAAHLSAYTNVSVVYNQGYGLGHNGGPPLDDSGGDNQSNGGEDPKLPPFLPLVVAWGSTQPRSVTHLTNGDQAVIDPNKVTSYALDPTHPLGKNKAVVFESVLGFNQTNANELINQIQKGAAAYPAVPGVTDQYGQRFTVDMPVTGPNGNTTTVRTGWIFDSGSTIPRLTTMYVK